MSVSTHKYLKKSGGVFVYRTFPINNSLDSMTSLLSSWWQSVHNPSKSFLSSKGFKNPIVNGSV